MSSRRPVLGWWMWGLVAFAVVVALSLAVTAPADVTLGITDHQAAATAARVDEIQAQWHAGGVRPLAIFAMIGDLAFIAIYGWGSWIAGRSFMPMDGIVRIIGAVVAASALVFVLTDYTETLLQLVQVLRDQGSDRLAGIAATVRPFKVAAWIVTFVGVIAAWLIRRFAAPTA
jgi:hypothetical protein